MPPSPPAAASDPAVDRLANVLYTALAGHCMDTHSRVDLNRCLGTTCDLAEASTDVQKLFRDLALSGIAHGVGAAS